MRSLLSFVERRILFYHWGPAVPFPRAPRAPHEDVWLQAADGVSLHAHWFACPDETPPAFAADPDRPQATRPVVLFLHGNAGTVERWYPVGHRWQQALGAHVLLLDYRGYGRSEGRPTEAGLYADGRAAYRHLVEERGVDPRRIVVVGQSLGGGVAVELATSGVEHAGLVLESTFAEFRLVVDRLFLGLPVHRWLESRFPSRERLHGYAKPLFVSHGRRDWLIPAAHAPRLVEAAAGPKELLILPRMGHHDKRADEYTVAVRTFFTNALGTRNGSDV